MTGRRIFVGRLPYRTSPEDIEHFFRGYGKIRDIDMKSGYCFVELGSSRDAEDAVRDLDRRTLNGERVSVEIARAPGRNSDDHYRRTPPRNNRYGPPERTNHRVIVENLSSRISWQSLKDVFRRSGDVCFADAHKSRPNEAIVEFASRSDMKTAIKKFDGYELSGRRLKVYEDYGRSRSRTRSRSRRSRSRSYSRSASRRSRSNSRSRRSNSRSRRSRSVSHKSRSQSRSRSLSKSNDRKKKRSRTPERSRNGTRSRSDSNRGRKRSHSSERSPSPSYSKKSRKSGSDSPPARSKARSISPVKSRSGSQRSVSGSRRSVSDPRRSVSHSRSRSRTSNSVRSNGSIKHRNNGFSEDERKSGPESEASRSPSRGHNVSVDENSLD